MKRITYAIALSILSCAASALETDGIELTIRFYDKAIYFPNSTVQIKLEIYNNSPDPVRFKMAGSRFFSIDFDVRSVSNVPADRSKTYLVGRGNDAPVYFREVSLEPGERFGFVEALDDYVEITEPGVYLVRAGFYPELHRGADDSVVMSNTLTLTIHPGTAESEDRIAVDIEAGEIRRRAALPPDEVVSFMLNARQHGLREQFLLYLDLERLFTRTDAADNQYRRLSEAERRRVLSQFREELAAPETKDGIALIPTSFEIVKTSYTPAEATVLVTERFKYPNFSEIKEYTYYLYRNDRVWLIYDYAVRNLGTE